MIWTRRGSKLSTRAKVIYEPNESATATLIIAKFSKHDLGNYICRAKSLNTSTLDYTVRGESHFYLMASDFGYDPDEQTLYGPDLLIKSFCNQERNQCHKPIRGNESILLTCSIDNFDTNYQEISINDLMWKSADGRPIGDGRRFRLQKITNTQISMYIMGINEQNVGKYACYAYTSAGTFRQLFEIARANANDDDDENLYRLIVSKPMNKKTELTVEQHYPVLTGAADELMGKPDLGNYYEFDCISGKIHRMDKFYLKKKKDF